MTGIFKQKTPGNIILLIILGILLKLPSFFQAKGPVIKSNDGVLYVKIVTFLTTAVGNSAFVFSLLAFLLNLIIAFTLLIFINKHRLMKKPNFLGGMSYLIITSLLPSFNWFSSSLLASVFLFPAFTLLFKSYNSKTEKTDIFNASLLIGIASLFFLPAIFFLVWAFLALAMLRPFKMSEWILILLGIITPYYFFATYLYFTDSMTMPNYFKNLTFLLAKPNFTLWHTGALFFLLMPILSGIYYLQQNSSKMLIHIRKGWYLFLWYLLIGLVVSFFNMDQAFENIVLVLIPAAAFHAYGYLNSEVKLYPKLSFWISIAFIVLAQLYSGLW